MNDHADIWSFAKATSDISTEGLDRVCRWTRVLAMSGVEIHWNILDDLVEKQTAIGESAEAKLDLVIAIQNNASECDPQVFATTCSRIFTAVSRKMTQLPKTPSEIE